MSEKGTLSERLRAPEYLARAIGELTLLADVLASYDAPEIPFALRRVALELMPHATALRDGTALFAKERRKIP